MSAPVMESLEYTPVDRGPHLGYHNDHWVFLASLSLAEVRRALRRCGRGGATHVSSTSPAPLAAPVPDPHVLVRHPLDVGRPGAQRVHRLGHCSQWGDYLAIVYFALYGIACVE